MPVGAFADIQAGDGYGEGKEEVGSWTQAAPHPGSGARATKCAMKAGRPASRPPRSKRPSRKSVVAARRSFIRNLDADETSIQSLYKAALISLRRRSPALTIGDHLPIAAENNLLIYRRRSADTSLIIALNFSSDPVSLASETTGLGGELLLSKFMNRAGERISGSLNLRGHEGMILL
jgi:hypothetical protein